MNLRKLIWMLLIPIDITFCEYLVNWPVFNKRFGLFATVKFHMMKHNLYFMVYSSYLVHIMNNIFALFTEIEHKTTK